MLPCFSLFRLVLLCCLVVIAALSVLLALHSLLSLPQLSDELGLLKEAETEKRYNPFHHPDSVQSFRSRVSRESHYLKKLAELSEAELRNLTELYHRNVTLQWRHRELLPPSKPLFDIRCLDTTDTHYHVTVSVVITYYNELSVLLMRTMTTILHRTLPQYLREIVLIDDHSSVNITGEIVEYSREQRIPLVYLHNTEQLGIASARRRGVSAASGDVVVLLDSHMEVSNGWLEPLLSVLKEKPSAIAVPLIHLSNENKYDIDTYNTIPPYYVRMQKAFGVFDIFLSEGSPTGRKWEAYPSSGMLGGALAGYKAVLERFYPQGLTGRGWGVENNRLSFRAWMCGEGVWMCPCSQILHPTGNDGLLLRYFSSAKLFNDLVAESVSEAINFLKTEEDKDKLISKFTNVEELATIIRKNSAKIRSEFSPEDHSCKNYSYYLSNVYEGYLSWERDQFTLVGEIESVSTPGVCLEPIHFKVVPYPCRRLLPTINDGHTMGFTKNFNIRLGSNDRFCWDSPSSGEEVTVIVFNCHTASATEGRSFNSQYFDYKEDTGQIVHVPTSRCLELADKSTAWLVKCDVEREQQRWKIKLSPWF